MQHFFFRTLIRCYFYGNIKPKNRIKICLFNLHALAKGLKFQLEPLGAPGRLWEALGSSGRLWEALGGSGRLWEPSRATPPDTR